MCLCDELEPIAMHCVGKGLRCGPSGIVNANAAKNVKAKGHVNAVASAAD